MALIGLVLLIWPYWAADASAGPLSVDPTSDRVWLTDHLSYFIDASGGLSLEQIQQKQRHGEFKPVRGLAVPTAFPPGTPTWIHFAVRFPSADPAVWWLLLTPDILPTVSLYAEQADGHFIRHEGGSSLPFKQREMPGVGHGFRLGEHPGEVRHFFIRMTGLLVTRAEPSLWQEKALIDYIGRYRGIFGLYVGMFGVLILMALVRALRYRKPLDIAYFLYLLGFELFNLSHNGFMQVFGLVDSQAAREALIQFGLFLTGFSFLTVTRTLVVWPRGSVWINRLLWAGIVITLLILLWAGAISDGMLMEANFNQAVFWVLTSGLMGLWAAWRGYPNARLFTACFLPFVLWAGALSIIRWLEAPLPETFTRYLVLMATSIIHLFSLWYLILSKDARLERDKRALEQRLSSLQNEMSYINLFMGMLRHELNRPLHALAALAQDKASPADTTSVVTQGLSLASIHDDFSEILRTCMDQIQSAAITRLETKPVDVGRLIQKLTENVQLKTHMHLVTSDIRDLPADFLCDPKLVSILLVNLMENAVRYSPEGGAVWVRARLIGPDMLEISVTDEGPGIPEWARERIFERYFRLNETAGPNTGMGLGLFIVKRIAEMHGGTVVCESEPGEGATFRVTLSSGA